MDIYNYINTETQEVLHSSPLTSREVETLNYALKLNNTTFKYVKKHERLLNGFNHREISRQKLLLG